MKSSPAIKASLHTKTADMAAVTSSASSTTSADLSKSTPLPHTPQPTDAASFNEKDTVAKEDGGISAGALDRELSRIDTSDFPSAFPLAMITGALMLSIFLCALGESLPTKPDD